MIQPINTTIKVFRPSFIWDLLQSRPILFPRCCSRKSCWIVSPMKLIETSGGLEYFYQNTVTYFCLVTFNIVTPCLTPFDIVHKSVTVEPHWIRILWLVYNINQLLHYIGFYSRVFVMFLFWGGVSRVKIKTKQIQTELYKLSNSSCFFYFQLILTVSARRKQSVECALIKRNQYMWPGEVSSLSTNR